MKKDTTLDIPQTEEEASISEVEVSEAKVVIEEKPSTTDSSDVIPTKRGALSIKSLLRISRPYWWSLTAFPFILGALLTGQPIGIATFVGLLYFLLPYNLALYGINDIYDSKNDAKNPRKKGGINGLPLEKSLHNKLWSIIFTINVPFVAYFLIAGSLFSSLFLATMFGLMLVYTGFGFRYKEVPIMGSINSAFHYSAPFIFAILLFNGFESWVGIFSTFFVWAIACHVFSSVQDVESDRKLKVTSVATKFGVRNSLYLSVLLYAVAAILPFVFYDVFGLLSGINFWLASGLLVSSFAVVPYLLVVLSNLVHYKKDKAPERAMKAQRLLVLLDLVLGFAIFAFILYLYTR